MLLTRKQQEAFTEWYKNLYGDTSRETGTGEIPRIHESHQKEHIKMRKDFLTNLIGPKNCKKKYIHRGGREDDYLHVIFGGLYLNYGPTFVDDEGNVSKKILWLDDVE